MKLVYARSAQLSFLLADAFMKKQGVSLARRRNILKRVKKKASILLSNPHIGQVEFELSHSERKHRRLVSGNYKIIYYLTTDKIIMTDIFDARQAPSKMKG